MAKVVIKGEKRAERAEKIGFLSSKHVKRMKKAEK